MEPESKREESPFERFTAATKRLLAVSKKEAQEQAEQEKRENQDKPPKR